MIIQKNLYYYEKILVLSSLVNYSRAMEEETIRRFDALRHRMSNEEDAALWKKAEMKIASEGENFFLLSDEEKLEVFYQFPETIEYLFRPSTVCG
jgi:adenylate kinase